MGVPGEHPTSRPRSRRRRFLFAAVALSTAISLLAGELSVRVYLHFVPPRLVADSVRGWRCVESYRSSFERADAAGRRHRVDYTTDAFGFRNSGDLHSGKPRVLVIGDSFTQAVAVSDDETYAALLGREVGCEVFAYGAGGYGTLQEKLVLEEQWARVNPQAVVWQFCTNDFINNDCALERASRIDNNGMVRPYLADDGTVSSALPKPLPWLRELSDTSKLLLVGFHLLDTLGARFGDSVEYEIAVQGSAHAGLQHSASISRKLLRAAATRVGDVPLLIFSADGREPYYTLVQRIAEEERLQFVPGVPEAVSRAQRAGLCTRDADRAHWNELGHQLCAHVLAPAVREALDRPRSTPARELGAR